MTTVAEIRERGIRDIFPTDKLIGHETALILFSAAFMGRQDACWVEEAGLTGTCVDNDAEALSLMEAIYPDGWDFFCADAYWYAVSADRQWDVVTVDCPTGAFDRCAGMAAEWCRLARHAVILGTGVGTVLEAPDGWAVTETIRRSDYDGGVYWSVLECIG